MTPDTAPADQRGRWHVCQEAPTERIMPPRRACADYSALGARISEREQHPAVVRRLRQEMRRQAPPPSLARCIPAAVCFAVYALLVAVVLWGWA